MNAGLLSSPPPGLFDYDPPQELIAQEPHPARDAARLLVVEKDTQGMSHRLVRDLPDLLRPGDLLVLNDTAVIRARLLGRRVRTGGKWEGLVLREVKSGLWELMCQTRGRLVAGETIQVSAVRERGPWPGPLMHLQLLEKTPERRWLARPDLHGSAHSLLQQFGQVPLPPYIRKGQAEVEDDNRYQTIYAQKPGAVAAPTAGLHFTGALFDALARRGIRKAHVTLHVGPGTFQPIQCEDLRNHHMHSEWAELPEATVAAIERTRREGSRVVAIGTTTVRVLEGVAHQGPLKPYRGEIDLFIYPPFEFKVVDVLLTNFHLPRSTLLALVGAFAGIECVQMAYQTAITERYRFYSYGDAMLIL